MKFPSLNDIWILIIVPISLIAACSNSKQEMKNSLDVVEQNLKMWRIHMEVLILGIQETAQIPNQSKYFMDSMKVPVGDEIPFYINKYNKEINIIFSLVTVKNQFALQELQKSKNTMYEQIGELISIFSQVTIYRMDTTNTKLQTEIGQRLESLQKSMPDSYIHFQKGVKELGF